MKQALAIMMIALYGTAALAADTQQEAESKSFYQDRQRGYWFYEPVPVPPTEEEVKKMQEPIMVVAPTPAPQPQPPQAKKTIEPREQLREMGKRWENLMAIAVMNPTPENIK